MDAISSITFQTFTPLILHRKMQLTVPAIIPPYNTNPDPSEVDVLSTAAINRCRKKAPMSEHNMITTAITVDCSNVHPINFILHAKRSRQIRNAVAIHTPYKDIVNPNIEMYGNKFIPPSDQLQHVMASKNITQVNIRFSVRHVENTLTLFWVFDLPIRLIIKEIGSIISTK